MKKIRKVVFPVAGLGTRFLPATKCVPKEMLPVVDKPIISYAFEEAMEAGIEQFIFVNGRSKGALPDLFDHAYELEAILAQKGKKKELESAAGWLPEPGNVMFTRQQQALGLGHAVWCARHLVGDEPFAVILPDDMVKCEKGVLTQMIEAYERTGGGNYAAVIDVPRADTKKYGIVSVDADYAAPDKRIVKATGLVEKPEPEKAPSTLSIIGRYILQPEIFQVLETQERGAGNEIQLTDGMLKLEKQQPFFGYHYRGSTFDCGSPEGFVEANIAFALARPDMRKTVLAMLDRLIADLDPGHTKAAE